MTAINSSIHTPAFPLGQNPKLSLEQSKKSTNTQLYLGPRSTNLPGISNVVFAPYEFIQSLKAMSKADILNDREGFAENGLRILSTPFSFLHAVSSLFSFSLKGGVFFDLLVGAWHQKALFHLSGYMLGIGLFICGIEAVLESIGLTKTLKFNFKEYPSELEAFKKRLSIDALEQFLHAPSLPDNVKNEIESFLKESQNRTTEEVLQLSENLLNKIRQNVYLTKLEQLRQNYFQISPKQSEKIDDYIQKKFSEKPEEEKQAKREQIGLALLERKKNALIRRVHPWLADEIEATVPGIIQNLRSANSIKQREGIEKAEEIYKNIKIQIQKKILVHSIGIAAVLLTAAGLILSCFALPFTVPFIVMAIATALAFSRYLLYAGYMDSKGWEFNVKNCIPSPIKKIYRKITEKKQPPLTLHKPLYMHFDLKAYRRTKQQTQKVHRRKKTPKLDYTISIPAWIKV